VHPGIFTAFVFKARHRAAVAVVLAGFCQLAPAQVSDGKGLTPLEGVIPITDDRALWDAVKDSRDVAELQAYLAQFPKGLFAAVAAIRIRALGGAGPATSPQAPPQAPPIAQRQNIAPSQVIKDCADCPEMVVIPAGSFEMGSNESANEQPVHRVNVPGFLLGKTEVTQGQWKAVMGNNPSRFSQCGEDCPVEQVNWNEAQEFARRLSQKTGNQYRLPSEAEWEYAARAGSNTKWSFGDNVSQLGDHAWHRGVAALGSSTRRACARPTASGARQATATMAAVCG
jgi:formylglycine-generating enzyme required for sulfatase activity